MLKKLMAKMQNEEGQGLVEYALIIVLVSIAAIATLTTSRHGRERRIHCDLAQTVEERSNRGKSVAIPRKRVRS